MTVLRKDSQEPETQLNDGAATMRLRELEKDTTVSRRHALWRAGAITAAGVGVLSALDQQRADAANGGNFILGQSNSATNVTTLTGAAGPQLLALDGSSMSATTSTLIVTSPTGGAGVFSRGNSTSTTTGLAISGVGNGTAMGVAGSSGSNTGVAGTSNSGTGVKGSSTSGTGVSAVSTSGTALAVSGKATFSNSGSGFVRLGRKSKTVKVSGMTAKSLVLVTLQSPISRLYVTSAKPALGGFTVHLNRKTPAKAKFAWFVLN